MTRSRTLALLFVGTSSIVAVCFAADILLPAKLGVALFCVTLAVAVGWKTTEGYAFLRGFMALLYFLPFSALIALVFLNGLPFSSTPDVVELVLDEQLIRQMLTVGAVGFTALVGGMLFGARRPVPSVDHSLAGSLGPTKTVGVLAFASLLVVALGLAVLSAGGRASGESYFTDAAEAAEGGGAFGTLYIVAYTLLACLFIDIQRGQSRDFFSVTKKVLLALVISYVVVVLQLTRGDRECAGLLVALLVLYITGPTAGARRTVESKRLRVLAPVAALFLIVFLFVGQERYSAADSSRVEGGVIATSVRELSGGGTWTAVLLGNLGLASEYRSGHMKYLLGQTYLEYAESLPPGLVARLLGIPRPVAGLNQPGLWYYPLQIGGVHPVVVPFRNFGILGALLVLFLEGLLIGIIERRGRSPAFWDRLVFGAVFVSGFNWFWYGDLPFIRGMLAAGVVGLMVEVALSVRLTRPRLERQYQAGVA